MNRLVLLEVEFGADGPFKPMRWPREVTWHEHGWMMPPGRDAVEKYRGDLSLFGVPIYTRDGHSVYVWNGDGHIVCGDRMMMLMGPFADEATALAGLDRLRAVGDIWGGMCHVLHCMTGRFAFRDGFTDPWPEIFYTDG